MRLTRANINAVRYACLHFHYAKTVPVVKVAYNVFNDLNEWCGVIIYGSGANNNLASSVGLIQGEVLELVRVALNGKQSCTSQCLAQSIRQLHKDFPLVKIIVSYADLDQDHAGIIYQATNWLYLGTFNVGSLGAFIVNGKKTHPKSIHSLGIKQNITEIRKRLDPNATEFYTKGKHKYIYVFNKKERKKWLTKTKPYPKKEVVTNATKQI
jgi:hypothetical protein